MRRRRVLAGFGIAFAIWLCSAAPAGAQQFMSCTATLNGVDHTTYSSPSKALKVAKDGAISVAATSDIGNFTGRLVYKVQLEIAGAKWSVASGFAQGESWSDTVSVKKYATRGAGIYKVIAVTESPQGGTCFGRAYIEVDGDGVLGTTAGQVATAATAAAAATTLAVGARKGKEDIWSMGEEINETAKGDAGTDERQAIADLHEEFKDDLPIWRFCGSAVLVGVAATLWAMASEHASNVIASIGRLWR